MTAPKQSSSGSRPMRHHDLKTWPEFFADLMADRKPFELRKNDRDFQVGDELRLHEYDPATEQFSGRVLVRRVDYILGHRPDAGCAATFGLQPGYVVMGISGVAQGQSDRGALTKLAAECHRAKWQFDITGDDEPPSKSKLIELVNKAFNALHRIGDLALKLRAESASPPAPLQAGETPLAWLAEHTNYELTYSGWDEDPVWQLHSVNGGRNDREWTLRTTGRTPEEALRKAMAMSSTDREGGK